MYSILVENKGDHQYWATSRNYKFVMGQNGANQIDTLLASLCGCIGHHIRDHLVERKIAFSKFAITAETTSSDDGLLLTSISAVLKVEGCTLTPADKEDLKEKSGACPVCNTLRKAIPVSFSVL